MADSVYELAVKLSLETMGIAGAAGMAMRAFGGIESEAARAEGVVAKLANSMGITSAVFTQNANKMGTYQTQLGAVTAAHTKLNQAMQGTALLAGGAILTGVGVGLFGALKGAADQAAQLVPLMTQIRIATQTPLGAAGDSTMRMLQQLGVQQGTRTQFSLQEEAGIMAAMTKAGIAGPGSVGRIQQMLPMISNFAEVMKMTRGDTATESATTATELAHLYGQYDAKVGKNGPGVNYMVDLAGKALSVTPGTQKTFLTTLSQMSGQMRPLYGSNRQGFINDSIALTMLEGQLGQQGRGGTQIASMLGRTLGAGSTAFGSRTSRQNKDMADLTALANKGGGNLSFFNNKGQFSGISEFLSILEKAAAAPGQSPEKIGALFRGAFGAVGLRQAGILADPITVSQFGKIGQYLGPNGVVDTAKQRDAYNASPTGQSAKLASNWSTVSSLVGQAYVPVMATYLGVLAGALGAVANFMSDHPGMTQLVSWAAAAAAGLTTLSGVTLMARGAFLLWGAAGEALGLAKLAKRIGVVTDLIRTQGVVTAVSTGITKVWAATQAAGAAVAGAAAGVYGVLDAAVIALSGGFSIATIAAAAFDVAASPVIAILGGLVLAGTAVYLVFKNWSTISGVLGNMLGWVGGKIHDLLVLLGLAQNMGNKTAVTVPAGAGARPGGVQATMPTGGTVGLPGSVYVPPIKGATGGGASPEYWTPATAGRGGGGGARPTVHVNLTQHIHAQPHHDERKIAAMASEMAQEAISRAMSMGQQYQASQFTGLEMPVVPFG